MARRPFKKDITPIGKGGVTKHAGKGAMERGAGGAMGGMSNPMNNYSKPSPDPDMDGDMPGSGMSDFDSDDA